MKRVGELVGVEDRFIVRAMRGTINLKLEKQVELCACFVYHILVCKGLGVLLIHLLSLLSVKSL